MSMTQNDTIRPSGMAKVFDATEVAKHNTAESCWVILYGNVYDVTEFLPSHPGGTRAILQLAGRDCTEDFDPIHPPGTLDELKPEAKLGAVDPESLKKLQQSAEGGGGGSGGSGGNNGSGGDDDDGNDKEVKQVVKKEEKFVCPPLESILNLDEMETVATKLVPRKAWSYYYSAGDDLASKRLNNTVYRQVLLRPRVFVDCTDCSTATTLLDGRLSVGVPVFVSPAAMARLGHPDGEAGIARGVSRFGALQIVSHNASMTVEQIAAAAAETPGQVLGWQIYVQKDRRKSEAMLARINGLPQYRCVVLTLDAPVPGKREDDERQQFGTNASFAAATQDVKAQPAGAGIGRQMFFGTATDLTWTATLPWLAAHTPLPIVLKGIQTHEDAFLAARYAAAHPGTVRAIILSNHGGRSLDTAPPALHTLLEIRKYCPAVFEHVEVWLDGGIRRGTDVVKALCLGARAVGVGRAALWGLGAGGTKGVDRAFEILSDEIKTCMRLLGVHAIADLNPRLVNTRALERDIFDGGSGLDQLAMPLPVQAKL